MSQNPVLSSADSAIKGLSAIQAKVAVIGSRSLVVAAPTQRGPSELSCVYSGKGKSSLVNNLVRFGLDTNGDVGHDGDEYR